MGVTFSGGVNDEGTVVKLTVSGALLNISTRLRVLGGDNALIAGFIITGTDPKTVIIRGIGPSLGAVGLQGAMADPTLELHKGDGGLLTSNDNWRDDQEAEIIATGIPPSDDLEAAIVSTLNPGTYTAVLRGQNDATGIAVVEAYDLSVGSKATLANISTRGFVDTGDNILIGGFIVGVVDARVIVRAIGPSLAQSVSGTLPDPTLELHNSNGTTVAFNDNWKDTQRTEIEATTIPPSNDLESAIVQTIPPGAYTAVVRGTNNTTGIAVVEAYQLQ